MELSALKRSTVHASECDGGEGWTGVHVFPCCHFGSRAVHIPPLCLIQVGQAGCALSMIRSDRAGRARPARLWLSGQATPYKAGVWPGAHLAHWSVCRQEAIPPKCRA